MTLLQPPACDTSTETSLLTPHKHIRSFNLGAAGDHFIQRSHLDSSSEFAQLIHHNLHPEINIYHLHYLNDIKQHNGSRVCIIIEYLNSCSTFIYDN